MSLITRCPACGTMFKVVPDQLRISEGWVRCGHCAEVFDAHASMQHEGAAPASGEPAATAPLPLPVSPSTDSPAPPRAQPPAQSPAPAMTAAPPSLPSVFQATAQPAPVQAASASGFERQGPPSGFSDSQLDRNLYKLLVDEPVHSSLPPEDPPPVRPAPVSATARASRPMPLDGDDDSIGDVSSMLPDSTLDDVSFVRQARRKAFWRRPAIRAMLSLVALLLVAGLGLQVAVHERDRIAAMEPGTKPFLQQLCVPLECTVAPLRQIESIVIDSSTFTKLRTDTYRLSFTLKNNGSLALAMPAIELALTDSSDQPVLRRVLQPADLGAAAPNLSPVLSAGGEWSGTFPLSVSAAGGAGARIVGYRLLAFYP